MCGLAGIWGAAAPEAQRVAVTAMRDAIRHRGPDAGGVWQDEDATLALAHARLSILDLSEAGAQPMADDRFALAYNGEVYNFRELRAELEGRGRRFRGESDTEVVLAALAEWGPTRAAARFIGMFAFALWDRRARALWLGRDRLGIKPLYVGRAADRLVFGSELSALEAAPGFERRVDRAALTLYFRYACVPGARSIYERVEQVRPGEVWRFDAADAEPKREAFWTAEGAFRAGLAERRPISEAEAIEQVEDMLGDAVERRMIADVPLGVFLSGGIDSSAVTALMQARSSSPVRTFSIGFGEAAFDEADDARRIARHLGTEHTELRVTPSDALATTSELGHVYAEPFADSSQLPTLLVCRMAREHVTVALSGDGGDEVFGGYNRHVWGPRVHRGLRWVPRPARRALSAALLARSPRGWDEAFVALGRIAPSVRTPGEKVHKLARLLAARDLDQLYDAMTCIWAAPASVVLGGHDVPRAPSTLTRASVAEQLMARDTIGYLADDILTKVDRASMSVGLEVRVPLLDHRLLELAWRLPAAMRVRGGVGKWVLREVLARFVPRAMFDRPKMGFGVPIGQWLRGPLREWAEALLAPERLRRESFLDVEVVGATWRDHLAGGRDRHHELWAALMFQSWLDARQGVS